MSPIRPLVRSVATLGLLGFFASCTSPAKPSLAIVDARVWTADSTRPWAEAIAIAGDRIVAVGTTAEIRKLVSSETKVVEGKGMMVVPGFFDSHVHFIDAGAGLSSVQLRDATTPREFIQRIADYARTLPPGAWIRQGDWDHTRWGGELPRRDWIDSVTPNNPVWVNRLDGHMTLANSAALRAAGVTNAIKDIPGGAIIRNARGELTGLFKDNARSAITPVVPPRNAEEDSRAIAAAMAHAARNGVTSITHMTGSAPKGLSDIAAFERVHKAGPMSTRIYVATPLALWEQLRDTVQARGRGDEWVRIGLLKGFQDGSIGSHTAAMLEPFTDAPKDSGLLVTKPEDMERWVSGADKAGLHVAVHAIGDRAIRSQLDLFGRVQRANGQRDRRFRIEHAQHIAPAELSRFAELGVIASMQPYHAIDDGRWVERVIGTERSKGTYAFKSLLDRGTTVALGSDWFVAPLSPLEGIYAAVTRETIDGANPNGWFPEQRISVEQALRGYTRDAAYASFAETERAALAPGMLADVVLLDRDLTQIPPRAIRGAKVVMTVVGGRIVHSSPAIPP